MEPHFHPFSQRPGTTPQLARPRRPRGAPVRAPGRAAALAAAAVLAVAWSPVALAAQEHGHPEGDPTELGEVTFAVSCDAAVAPRFERAVAMLHSFWFGAAETEFGAVAEADPSCAMAWWGIAMTAMGNPMTRALPAPEQLEKGRAAAEKAVALAADATHREQMYADAALAYFAAEGGFADRMTAHESAMDALRQAHADDPEATIFYGRAAVANAPPEDLTFARQIAAAELMRPLFEARPRHPGLAHYIIHAYDAPALAERGRDAAFAYADIAPSAPHALHMPSHIFTRLGLWDESIETNDRSANAAPDPDAEVHPLDYMVYAYLQQGRDDEARAVVERAVDNPDRFYAGLMGYNFAAMPARYALERNDWAAAADLRVPARALPYVEAVTRFARALGAARGGAPDGADRAAAETDALAGLQATLAEAGERYWATIVRAQRIAADAWIARARGDDATALLLAREAAEVEATVEKHPVTPGPLIPAAELLGDLLLELDRPEDALAAYQATLESEPRRARATFGAARAAEAAGDRATAERHYRALLEIMTDPDPERGEVARAKRFLAGG